MSGPNDSSGEMPVFPFPRRERDRPVLPDGATLDRLFAGDDLNDHPSPEVHALADLLAAARAPGTSQELAGEAADVAAFVRTRHAGYAATPTTARRRPVFATILRTKLAAAVAAGTVTFGGVVAAAYAGALPEPIQEFAHQTVGAPAANGDSGPVPPGHDPGSDIGDPSLAATVLERPCETLLEAQGALANATDRFDEATDISETEALPLAEAASALRDRGDQFCSETTPDDQRPASGHVCKGLFEAQAALDRAADMLDNTLGNGHTGVAAEKLAVAAEMLAEALKKIKEHIRDLCTDGLSPTQAPPLPHPVPDLPTDVDLELPTGLPTPLPTALPTSLPTSLPTQLPTGLPSGLPTDIPHD